VWATDSFHGTPAGVVHRRGDDDFGGPDGTACGTPAAGLWFFAGVSIADIPPTWRCPVCELIETGSVDWSETSPNGTDTGARTVLRHGCSGVTGRAFHQS
jgi:hypothetical protein